MAKTQHEIAKALGVSQMMVSRALNNKPGVEEKKREEILEFAEKFGYRPNRLARSLITKKSNIVGLIIPSVTYSFFPEITNSIEKFARARGYRIILCHTNEHYEQEEEDIGLLREMRVDGLIITPASDRRDTALYRTLQKEEFPIVLIDRYFEDFNCNCVVTNNFNGAYQMVQHLLRTGYRQIAHIQGPPDASSSREIFKGYQKALLEHSIAYDPEIVIQGGFEEQDGYKAAKRLLELRREKKISAIFCVSDPVAIGAFSCLKEHGVRVPDDIALAGFSDIKGAAMLAVPLTTVREQTHELGKQAVQMLIDEIEHGVKKPKKVLLEPTLVIRSSCGANTRKA